MLNSGDCSIDRNEGLKRSRFFYCSCQAYHSHTMNFLLAQRRYGGYGRHGTLFVLADWTLPIEQVRRGASESPGGFRNCRPIPPFPSYLPLIAELEIVAL